MPEKGLPYVTSDFRQLSPPPPAPLFTTNSVSCGIPDFRSKDGVYDLVPRLDLGLGCAEDLFDLEFFVHDPAPFFKFAKVWIYYKLGLRCAFARSTSPWSFLAISKSRATKPSERRRCRMLHAFRLDYALAPIGQVVNGVLFLFFSPTRGPVRDCQPEVFLVVRQQVFTSRDRNVLRCTTQPTLFLRPQLTPQTLLPFFAAWLPD